MHGEAGDGGGTDYPHRGQRQGGFQADPKGLAACAEAAVQENNGQRQVAQHKGQTNVIKVNATGTVFTGEHAQHQKDQQNRRTQFARHHTGKNAQQGQQGTDKNNLAGELKCHAGTNPKAGTAGRRCAKSG